MMPTARKSLVTVMRPYKDDLLKNNAKMHPYHNFMRSGGDITTGVVLRQWTIAAVAVTQARQLIRPV